MNPLPGGQGKVFLIPSNMVPADRIDEIIDVQVKPNPAPTPPAPAASPAAEPDAAAAKAHAAGETQNVRRAVVDYVAGRLARREISLVGKVAEAPARGPERLAEFYARFVGDGMAEIRPWLTILRPDG
jgi:hypothetical protein